MKIKILLCSPTYSKFPIFSWLIKFFGKTKYSHYAIQYSGFVLDATSRDVRLSTAKEFKSRYDVVRSYDIEFNSDFESFTNWCGKHLNKKYGFFQIIGLLFMIMGLAKRNPFGKDSKNLVCNELVVLLLSEFKGFTVGDSDNYNLTQTEKIVKEYSC